MRQARILYKDMDAAVLTQHDDGSFTFIYNDLWLTDSEKPDISLSLPKNKNAYHSEFLFPFFYNMLPEGSNKEVVCMLNRVDQDDYFGILTITARNNNIGAIKVIKIKNP